MRSYVNVESDPEHPTRTWPATGVKRGWSRAADRTPLAGGDIRGRLQLQSPSTGANALPADIGPLLVAAATIVACLVAWGLLAALERLTVRARTIWLAVALSALAGSLMLPLSGAGVSAVNRAVLVLMHLAVGAVLIPVLYRTSPPPARAVECQEHRTSRSKELVYRA